jgi:hypothetical protein
VGAIHAPNAAATRGSSRVRGSVWPGRDDSRDREAGQEVAMLVRVPTRTLVLAGVTLVAVAAGAHLALPGSGPRAKGTERAPWIADRGDGTYRNPVLHAAVHGHHLSLSPSPRPRKVRAPASWALATTLCLDRSAQDGERVPPHAGHGEERQGRDPGAGGRGHRCPQAGRRAPGNRGHGRVLPIQLQPRRQGVRANGTPLQGAARPLDRSQGGGLRDGAGSRHGHRACGRRLVPRDGTRLVGVA